MENYSEPIFPKFFPKTFSTFYFSNTICTTLQKSRFLNAPKNPQKRSNPKQVITPTLCLPYACPYPTPTSTRHYALPTPTPRLPYALCTYPWAPPVRPPLCATSSAPTPCALAPVHCPLCTSRALRVHFACTYI